MKKVLVLAAAGEAVFGLVLLVYPPIVVRLLFNAQISGAGMVMSRVAGISLIALGVACWPDDRGSSVPAFRGMICYGLLAALYLAFLGIGGEWAGGLLWPAVIFHMALTVLLVCGWLNERRSARSDASGITGKQAEK